MTSEYIGTHITYRETASQEDVVELRDDFEEMKKILYAFLQANSERMLDELRAHLDGSATQEDPSVSPHSGNSR